MTDLQLSEAERNRQIYIDRANGFDSAEDVERVTQNLLKLLTEAAQQGKSRIESADFVLNRKTSDGVSVRANLEQHGYRICKVYKFREIERQYGSQEEMKFDNVYDACTHIHKINLNRVDDDGNFDIEYHVSLLEEKYEDEDIEYVREEVRDRIQWIIDGYPESWKNSKRCVKDDGLPVFSIIVTGAIGVMLYFCFNAIFS